VPGSGKTTLAMQFLIEGVRRGEPVLYMNFQENPTQLARVVGSLGGSPDEAGRLWHAMYVSPVELQIDSLIGRAFSIIRESGIRRVVLDGIRDLLQAAGDPLRVHDYLYALTQHLARNEVSSLLTYESGLGLRATYGSLTDELHFSALTDCMILFDVEATERLHRTACVLKARNSAHDLTVRRMDITADGIRIPRK
jgi:circadian clock protein KaiC